MIDEEFKSSLANAFVKSGAEIAKLAAENVFTYNKVFGDIDVYLGIEVK